MKKFIEEEKQAQKMKEKKNAHTHTQRRRKDANCQGKSSGFCLRQRNYQCQLNCNEWLLFVIVVVVIVVVLTKKKNAVLPASVYSRYSSMNNNDSI